MDMVNQICKQKLLEKFLFRVYTVGIFINREVIAY